MKSFATLFLCMVTQFVFTQTLYLDRTSSPNESIKEHDRAFYKENTIAYTYTDENGIKMPYRLFLPPDYNPTKKYPLLLSFHGAGSRGDDNLKHLRSWVAGWMDKQIQNEYPCFILMPQCPIKQKWVDISWEKKTYLLKNVPLSKPMKLAKEILDKVIQENSVDKSRIYVMGASMGGYGTWDFIMRYPKLIAAAVPICGVGDPSMAKKIRKTPIWAFHGDKDKLVPLSSSTDMIESLNGFKKNKARLTIYKGVGHNSYELAWKEPELIDWVFSQKK